MKKGNFVYIFLLSLCLLFMFNIIKFDKLQVLQNGSYVSYDEIHSANESNRFGHFIKLSLSDGDVKTDGNIKSQNEVVVKLFGIIPIKKRINNLGIIL